ncbi:hypothetical protein SeMB42_g07489, partial [Synchytrium endobioticum]
MLGRPSFVHVQSNPNPNPPSNKLPLLILQLLLLLMPTAKPTTSLSSSSSVNASIIHRKGGLQQKLELNANGSKPGLFNAWLTCYVVLTERQLLHYASITAFVDGKKHLCALDMANATAVQVLQHKEKNVCMFRLTLHNDAVYLYTCKGKDDMTAWTLAIQGIAKVAGALHIEALEAKLAETKYAARGATTISRTSEAMQYVEKIQTLQLMLEKAKMKYIANQGGLHYNPSSNPRLPLHSSTSNLSPRKIQDIRVGASLQTTPARSCDVSIGMGGATMKKKRDEHDLQHNPSQLRQHTKVCPADPGDNDTPLQPPPSSLNDDEARRELAEALAAVQKRMTMSSAKTASSGTFTDSPSVSSRPSVLRQQYGASADLLHTKPKGTELQDSAGDRVCESAESEPIQEDSSSSSSPTPVQKGDISVSMEPASTGSSTT